MDTGILILICGLASGYLTRSLLLEKKESHEGLFLSKGRWVRFPPDEDGEIHQQRFALPDFIRLIFLAYTVKRPYFYVHERRSQVWSCPFCLSFWASTFIVSIIIMGGDLDYQYALVYFFASATIARWVAEN